MAGEGYVFMVRCEGWCQGLRVRDRRVGIGLWVCGMCSHKAEGFMDRCPPGMGLDEVMSTIRDASRGMSLRVGNRNVAIAVVVIFAVV